MKAIFAAGCFWGVQYHFQRMKGVLGTIVGYIGGNEEFPKYEEVKAHKTHHVEAIQVEYDESIVGYEDLCKLFFEIHDPSQTDGIGPDLGPQYRSVIFFMDDNQLKTAESLIKYLRGKGYTVNTQLREATQFWPAEDYHQHYYDKTGDEPYCHIRTKKF